MGLVPEIELIVTGVFPSFSSHLDEVTTDVESVSSSVADTSLISANWKLKIELENEQLLSRSSESKYVSHVKQVLQTDSVPCSLDDLVEAFRCAIDLRELGDFTNAITEGSAVGLRIWSTWLSKNGKSAKITWYLNEWSKFEANPGATLRLGSETKLIAAKASLNRTPPSLIDISILRDAESPVSFEKFSRNDFVAERARYLIVHRYLDRISLRTD